MTVTATDGETGTATETIEVTAPRNRFASITDNWGEGNPNPANEDRPDTGELRLSLDEPVLQGRITFDFRFREGPGADIQDGFIHLAGGSTTSDFAICEVRFKDNAPHEWREGASDDTIAASSFPTGAPDVWSSIQLAWSGDGVNLPTYSLWIDGTAIICLLYTSPSPRDRTRSRMPSSA